MKTQEVRKLVGNTFFSATFIKKNGEVRKMHCRCGVKKGLKGVGKKYNDVEKNLLTVYDIRNKGYRTINLNTLTELKAKGKVIKC